MSRTLTACFVAMAAAAVIVAAPSPDPVQTTKKGVAKKSSALHKPVSTRPTAHASTATHSATASSAGSSVHKPTTRTITSRKHTAAFKPPPVTWRSRQTVPSPDRYREIQQALASKGYMTAEQANGSWNDSSADALRRFQTDQNIGATGKINSLSLIALGLGPKHETGELPKPEAQQKPEQLSR